MESEDGGKSWSYLGEIAKPEDGIEAPNETTVHETPSGRLIAFIRQQGTRAYGDKGELLTATSSDGGRTWTKPVEHQLWGYPYTAVALPSGRVLLAYGYRREPYGIRARLLDAECQKIDEAEELVVRDDGGRSDLGYPQATLMTDGNVLLTYYFNSIEDGGKQSYVAASILAEA